MINYQTVNIVISASAVKAFGRHLWYLTPEMVVFALFSNEVPLNERCALADVLLTILSDSMPCTPKHRYGFGCGKPSFPKVTQETMLADFVNEDSWFTANLLRLNMTFLTKNFDSWQNDDHFKVSKFIVDALNVVNDPSERAVKLTNDFVSSAREEDHFQNLLQVVECDRKA